MIKISTLGKAEALVRRIELGLILKFKETLK